MRKYQRLFKKIHQLMPTYRAMTNETLQNQTQVLKTLLSQGKTLEDLLPQAFAVIIEADKRVLGLEPYEVQVLGGLALFFGNIAEIKTGEGMKSVSARLD